MLIGRLQATKYPPHSADDAVSCSYQQPSHPSLTHYDMSENEKNSREFYSLISLNFS